MKPNIEKIQKKQTEELLETKIKSLESLFGGHFDDIQVSHRPTIFDFHESNPDTKENEYLKWINRELKISSEKIKSNDKETYRLLNASLKFGKNFLKEMLMYTDAELDIVPDVLSGPKDIFNILEKTKVARAGEDNNGLDRSVAYCRIVKAVIAAYEVLSNNIELLGKMTDRFGQYLTNDLPPSKYHPLIITGETNTTKTVMINDGTKAQGVLETRNKDPYKLMLRFINRPESNARKAYEDGVAARIIIEKNDAMRLVPILTSWLVKSMKAENLVVANKKIFTMPEMEKLSKAIRDSASEWNVTIKSEAVSNDGSAGYFSAIVITGRLPNRTITSKEVSTHIRQFEIMIVLPDNENDTAKNPSNHHIYDMNKIIMARTRLDGYCPVGIFEKLLEDTARKTSIDSKQIKKWLLEPQGEGKALVKNIKKGNKEVYVSSPVIERWKTFNFVEDYVSEQL